MSLSTSTELCGGSADVRTTQAESHMLCAIMLACYTATLAAVCVFVYMLLALVQSAAAQHIVNIYLPAGI